MKRLFVIRHAQAERGEPGIHDIARELTSAGRDEALRASASFVIAYPNIDVIITSNASRAQQTAAYFSEACGVPRDSVVVQPDIYEAPYLELLRIVNAIFDEHTSAILVGHMPGVTLLVNALADENLTSSPTCSIAVIEFPYASSWQEVSEGMGRLAPSLGLG